MISHFIFFNISNWGYIWGTILNGGASAPPIHCALPQLRHLKIYYTNVYGAPYPPTSAPIRYRAQLKLSGTAYFTLLSNNGTKGETHCKTVDDLSKTS